MTNRVVVNRPITVRSLNGPGVTVIDGASTMRCVYLVEGATLIGFTLTNGIAQSSGDSDREQSGGGVWCASINAVVSNCVLSGNLASYGGGAYGATLNNCALSGNSGGRGGGAYSSTLNRCLVSSNFAREGGGAFECVLNNCALTGNAAYLDGVYGSGGGALFGTLNNCTLTGNSAAVGGGAGYATLNNCVVYYNVALEGGANYFGTDGNPATLNYCCTSPLPPGGIGNFTTVPLFVNPVGGNLRLQSNSPCINRGNNSYVAAIADLDGRPRIVGGRVDVGAYEHQGAASGVFIGWLQQHGMSTDGSADNADPDDDRLNNYHEWRAGTNPTDSASVLRLRQPMLVGSDLVVTWESVLGRRYIVEGSTNLALPASFGSVAANILGQPGTTTYTHTNAAGSTLRFYRVGVEE
jgi:hypothetical protein